MFWHIYPTILRIFPFFSSSENDTGSEVVSSQYESTSTVNRAAAAEMNVDGDETGLENEDIMFNSCH